MKWFELKDHISACVRPAQTKNPVKTNCGDAVLIDLKNGLYAVCDSPERNPDASLQFLKKFHCLIESLKLYDGKAFTSRQSTEKQINLIISKTNTLIKTIKYNNNTTFSGVFLINTCLEKKILLLHCGDSLLYHFRTQAGTVCQLTQTNHYFVGRTQTLYQASLFDFYPDSKLMLATDGIRDLFREEGISVKELMETSILDIMGRYPVHRIAEELLNRYGRQQALNDDLGLVVFDPGQRPLQNVIDHKFIHT